MSVSIAPILHPSLRLSTRDRGHVVQYLPNVLPHACAVALIELLNRLIYELLCIPKFGGSCPLGIPDEESSHAVPSSNALAQFFKRPLISPELISSSGAVTILSKTACVSCQRIYHPSTRCPPRFLTAVSSRFQALEELLHFGRQFMSQSEPEPVESYKSVAGNRPCGFVPLEDRG